MGRVRHMILNVAAKYSEACKFGRTPGIRLHIHTPLLLSRAECPLGTLLTEVIKHIVHPIATIACSWLPLSAKVGEC